MLGARGSRVLPSPATPHRILRYLVRCSFQPLVSVQIRCSGAKASSDILRSLQDCRWARRISSQPKTALGNHTVCGMSENPVLELWRRHPPSAGYPAGVVRVPEPIPGLAFFPGGYGLWDTGPDRPLPDFPVGGVMVLGHDFHSEAGYRDSLARGRESPTQPTWRNLLALLNAA